MEYKMASIGRDFHDIFEKAKELSTMDNGHGNMQIPPNIESTDIGSILQQQQQITQPQIPLPTTPQLPPSSHVQRAVKAIKDNNECTDAIKHNDLCVTKAEPGIIQPEAEQKNDFLKKIGPLEDIIIVFVIVALLSSELTTGYITQIFTFATNDFTRSSILGSIGMIVFVATKLIVS